MRLVYDVPSSSRRRHEPEFEALRRTAHVPSSDLPQSRRSRRRRPEDVVESPRPPAVIRQTPSLGEMRRRTRTEISTVTMPTFHGKEAVPVSVDVSRPVVEATSYVQPQSEDSDEDYSWQRPRRRDADQDSNQSTSPPVAGYYDSSDDGRPRVNTYKAEDPSYYVADRPLSPIGGDLDAYDEFNFLFPTSEAKDEELSDLESPAVDSDSAHREDREIPGTSNAKRIYSSRYTGSAEPGGIHTAKLTELFDSKGKKRSLFKWL